MRYGLQSGTRTRFFLWSVELVAMVICTVFFLVPFYFIIVNSFKTSSEAAQFSMSWPKEFRMIENFVEVFTVRDHMLLLAYYNSTIITLFSILILIFVCSLTGFVMQRRSRQRAACDSVSYFSGTDGSTGDRADDLGTGFIGVVQNDAGDHFGHGSTQYSVYHDLIFRFYLNHSQGN